MCRNRRCCSGKRSEKKEKRVLAEVQRGKSVEKNDLAQRLLILRRAVAEIEAQLRATDATIVARNLVGDVGPGEGLRGEWLKGLRVGERSREGDET